MKIHNTKIYIYFCSKEYTPRRKHDLESFVKLFYILYTGDNTPFGNEGEDANRINSAKYFWENFEKKCHQFWTDALTISRSTSSNILEELYNHFMELPMMIEK